MIALAQLEGFYWVARCQGYTRAASAFPYPITQPAVHKQVRKLELELGARLFERVARDRVVLTPAGERLYAFAAPFFAGLPEVVQEIGTATYGGKLRVETSGLVLRYLLPGWIRRLLRKRPDIEVSLTEHRIANTARLHTGETDVIIDFLPSVPNNVSARVAATAYPFLVAPSGSLGVARLRTLPFVSYSPHLPHYGYQLRALELIKVAPDRFLSAGNVDSILSLVQAGLGFSFVPWLGRSGPRLTGLVSRRITAVDESFRIHAAWRTRSEDNPILAALMEAMPGRSRRKQERRT